VQSKFKQTENINKLYFKKERYFYKKVHKKKMLYFEEKIAGNLICPRCQSKFFDPRLIVPCFETLCLFCIEDLTNKTNNELDCFFCHAKHAIPAGGFVPNKIAAQMLNLKANQIPLSPNMAELKEKHDRIQNLTQEFESTVVKSRLIVNEHCLELKAQIDVLVETRKKELDIQRDELFQKINSYERECVVYLEKIGNKFLSESLERAKTFARDLGQYLQRINKNPDFKSREADDHLASLNTLLRQANGVQFGGQLLKFHAIVESKTESIGFLELEKLETPVLLETGLFSFKLGKN
jgi:hypothetical protein